MPQVKTTEAVRQRVLDDWLDVLTQLELEKDFSTEAGVPLGKEFVEKLKITSLEIRVSLKEMGSRADGHPDGDKKQSLKYKKLKLIS